MFYFLFFKKIISLFFFNFLLLSFQWENRLVFFCESENRFRCTSKKAKQCQFNCKKISKTNLIDMKQNEKHIVLIMTI